MTSVFVPSVARFKGPRHANIPTSHWTGLGKRYDSGLYTPDASLSLAASTTNVVASATLDPLASSSSAVASTTSVESVTTTALNSAATPAVSTSSILASSTLDSYSAPSSTYTPIASTSSAVYTPTPSTTAIAVLVSSTPLAIVSSALSTSPTSIAPTPTTLAVLPTSLLASATTSASATPSATMAASKSNSVVAFFQNLGSSPLNIVLTSAVSVAILVILIVIVSFVIRRCLFRRKRESVTSMADREDQHSFGPPPAWTPFGQVLDDEKDGAARAVERPRLPPPAVPANFSPQYPVLRPLSLAPVANRTSLHSAPRSVVSAFERPRSYPVGTIVPPTADLRPFALRSSQPILPITNYSRPLQHAAPALTTRENLEAWKEWALGAGVAVAGAAAGLVSRPSVAVVEEMPCAISPPRMREVERRQSVLDPRNIPDAFSPATSSHYEQFSRPRPTSRASAPISTARPLSHPPLTHATLSFGQRAVLERADSTTDSVLSRGTFLHSAHVQGASKMNRSRLAHEVEIEQQRSSLQRTRTMLSSSSESSSIYTPPARKTAAPLVKTRSIRQVRRNLSQSFKTRVAGRSDEAAGISGRERLMRARALVESESRW